MPKPIYSSSLSQTQGRAGYSILFRHPARIDGATGKKGLRIRRGLGTRDLDEAEGLKSQLNQLLADPRFHSMAARADAERLFDSRIVEIFYDQMVPEAPNFVSLREEIIPLPESSTGEYRRVLFLGTTGAGKTTLVRQIIGTDPINERFPSTSTAKTTIHDTEIVFHDGPYRAAVTFMTSDEVRDNVGECISAAVLAAHRNEGAGSILQRLLRHVNQRFRLNYILGNGPKYDQQVPDFDDEFSEDGLDSSDPDHDAVVLAATDEFLKQCVSDIQDMASRLAKELNAELPIANSEDERVLEEIFEEELDNLLRDDEEFHRIADGIMDEIEKRFQHLPPGSLSKTKQGWPLVWHGEWEADDREQFLKAVSTFSSNHAADFGRLLTPLVNGVRVAGSFRPVWANEDIPKLVLFDGEGLGHTPTSSSSVSTSISRRIEEADAVVLVDNATQPMQAAALAAMRELVSTGNARKLILAFTHFDEVKGDNLPDSNAKARHVLESVENVLSAFGEELGPYAERALRERLASARVFLAHMQNGLSTEDLDDKQPIQQLGKLIRAIDEVIQRPEKVESRPVYNKLNLAFVIKHATKAFHDSWRPRLGLETNPTIQKEHWSRPKALSRRLAVGIADEYDTLRPIADLRKEIIDRIFVYIQSPERWEGIEPNDDEKQTVFESFAEAIAARLLDLSAKRLRFDPIAKWQEAYGLHGSGSTFVRAKLIGDGIYEQAAPVPDITPSPDRNAFFNDVVAEIEAAAKEAGVILR